MKVGCKSLSKPSEATAKVLSKLFPGSYKRKFDPLSECVNLERKRKKKAAFTRFKGRPKVITVLFLSDIPSTIPKGTAREHIKKEGRMKDVPFFRCASSEEIKELINEVFSGFSSDFIFLEGQKNNSISVAIKQGLDGKGVIDLARHGSLYLKESSSNSAAMPIPVTSAEGTTATSVQPAHLKDDEILFDQETEVVEVNYL